MKPRARWWMTVLAALWLLNVSLTFANIWPTPAVTWHGEISTELAALVLLLIAASRARPVSSKTLRVLTIVWILLVAGRYADVTVSALFGREINLYWDLRFIPDVASLLAEAAHVWLVLGVLAALVAVIGLLYVSLRWALGRVADAAAQRLPRRILGSIACVLLAVFAVESWTVGEYEKPAVAFGRPVTLTYARQIGVAVRAMTGSTVVPASPPMTSDLARVKDADVYLIFIESYGAVTYDNAGFARRLEPSRAALETAIRDTGRAVVSAFVTSPTFGGNSWLAHISLMSGVEVRDPDVNAMLMAQKRETIVTNFKRGGYRTIALMPGLWQAWPEGGFYGFDEIYGGRAIDYRGPSFGWFDIPDEVSLATFDAREADRPSRAPLFVFYPTINTHTPFKPLPPYQPDWSRLLSGTPFDEAALDRAYDEPADWLNLGPGYTDAVAYTNAVLAGYLRRHRDRDLLMIVLGDHQPPALVSGEGAPWDVPVHVIASRRDVLDRLVSHGFRPGLTPARPVLSKMNELLPVLLNAFAGKP